MNPLYTGQFQLTVGSCTDNIQPCVMQLSGKSCCVLGVCRGVGLGKCFGLFLPYTVESLDQSMKVVSYDQMDTS